MYLAQKRSPCLTHTPETGSGLSTHRQHTAAAEMSQCYARESDPVIWAHPRIMARKEDVASTNVGVENGRHEICPRVVLGVDQPALERSRNTEMSISRIPREEIIYHTTDREQRGARNATAGCMELLPLRGRLQRRIAGCQPGPRSARKLRAQFKQQRQLKPQQMRQSTPTAAHQNTGNKPTDQAAPDSNKNSRQYHPWSSNNGTSTPIWAPDDRKWSTSQNKARSKSLTTPHRGIAVSIVPFKP